MVYQETPAQGISHMTSGLARDRELVEEAITGLEAAMHDYGLDRQDLAHDQYAQQRLNKLGLCGILWRYDDPSVQRSWHRYGLELGNSIKEYNSIQAKPLDEHPISAGTSSDRKYTRIQEYYYYYLEDFNLQGMNLEEAIQVDFFSLLDAFYTEYADPEYKDLYLTNVDLQRRLYNDSESLSIDEISDEDCLEIGDIVSELHAELYSCDLLRHEPDGYRDFVENEDLDSRFANLTEVAEEVYEAVEMFTDLLEDIYMMLARSDPTDVIGTPSKIIDNLRIFYHEFAWKMVATVLSIQTATGRDYQEIWRGCVKEMEWLATVYNRRLSEVKSTAGQANLLPELDDYEFSEPEHDLLRESIQVTSIQSD